MGCALRAPPSARPARANWIAVFLIPDDTSSASVWMWSADLRKTEVHAAGPRIGPAAGDHLGSGVELDALRPVDVQVAEQRGFPAAEAVVGHRHGNRHVDPNHPGFNVELKLACGSSVASEDRDAVPIGI